MVLTAAPVLPMLMVSAEASVPMLIAPVVPDCKVKAVAAAEAMVSAPESAMLLVVKVCVAITVPVTKLATPALVTFQVLEVPEISLPVPELEMVKTSPEADAFDCVKPKTEPVSVPVPEMLEVNWMKLAVSFFDPVLSVTTVRLAKTSARASAAVKVPERLIW